MMKLRALVPRGTGWRLVERAGEKSKHSTKQNYYENKEIGVQVISEAVILKNPKDPKWRSPCRIVSVTTGAEEEPQRPTNDQMFDTLNAFGARKTELLPFDEGQYYPGGNVRSLFFPIMAGDRDMCTNRIGEEHIAIDTTPPGEEE